MPQTTILGIMVNGAESSAPSAIFVADVYTPERSQRARPSTLSRMPIRYLTTVMFDWPR